MALTEGGMKGGDGTVKNRPPTTEWPYGGPDAPKNRIQKDGVDYSLVFLVVSFFILGFTAGRIIG